MHWYQIRNLPTRGRNQIDAYCKIIQHTLSVNGRPRWVNSSCGVTQKVTFYTRATWNPTDQPTNSTEIISTMLGDEITPSFLLSPPFLTITLWKSFDTRLMNRWRWGNWLRLRLQWGFLDIFPIISTNFVSLFSLWVVKLRNYLYTSGISVVIYCNKWIFLLNLFTHRGLFARSSFNDATAPTMIVGRRQKKAIKIPQLSTLSYYYWVPSSSSTSK